MLEKILSRNSALGKIAAGLYDDARKGNGNFFRVRNAFGKNQEGIKRFLMELAPKGE